MLLRYKNDGFCGRGKMRRDPGEIFKADEGQTLKKLFSVTSLINKFIMGMCDEGSCSKHVTTGIS